MEAMAAPLEAKPSGPERLNAVEAEHAVRDYRVIMPALADEIARIGGDMARMREQDVPDRTAYENLRNEAIISLERVTDLQQRLVAIARGETDASSAVVARAIQELLSQAERQEAAEDAYRAVLEADIAWYEREGARAERAERTMPLELYDERVRELISDVGMLEWAFNRSALTTLTREKLEEFHEGLTAAYEQLAKLDENAPDHVKSAERRSLTMLIQQLKERYPLTALAQPQAVLQAYQRAKAGYAAVSHRLPQERRTYYRTRLAEFARTADAVVERAWREIADRKPDVQGPPSHDPSPDVIRQAVQLAMNRATFASRPIADAVLSGAQRNKGLFGTLAGVFRLK
jgi:hypothetical protein